MIFGKTSEFAIEVEQSNNENEYHMQIWFKSKSFGAFKAFSNLKSPSLAFKKLLNTVENLPDIFYPLSEFKIEYDLFEKNVKTHMFYITKEMIEQKDTFFKKIEPYSLSLQEHTGHVEILYYNIDNAQIGFLVRETKTKKLNQFILIKKDLELTIEKFSNWFNANQV